MPNKKELFSSQQLRELNLIKLLSQKTITGDYKKICRHLDCSFITLQSELAHLTTFPGISAFPYIEPHLTINFQKDSGPQKLYQSVLLEAPSLRLLEYFFFQTCHNLETLANKLFISLSTLKRLIKRTNNYLKQNFDCQINIKRFSITGNEKQIRLFYLKYFSEAYDHHEWPFENHLNEQTIEELIQLVSEKLDASINYPLFHHLKILTGVHLIRFSQGYRVNEIYPKSQLLCQKFKSDAQLCHIQRHFQNMFSEPLNCLTLSEIFSAYFLDDLIINCQQIPHCINSQEKITFYDWLELLDDIENLFPLHISNKTDICRLMHNATLLEDYDIYENFLVYDYRQPFLTYFEANYPDLWQSLRACIASVYDTKAIVAPDNRLNHLLYILLINWDNLFIQLSNAITKQKLLVVEKGACNVGQFLQAFAGQFFEISIHRERDIKKHHIEGLYDIVLTDVSLEQVDGTDIYFFSQLVPSLALAQLNQHLKMKIQDHFKIIPQ